MTEIRFYHLTAQSLEEALPVMLERTVERDKRRAVVLAMSEQRIEALNMHLWTYDERKFLPHGSQADGFAEMQPVWLSVEDKNPNQAQVLFLTEGASTVLLDDYVLICELFDGNDEQAVATARGHWQAYKTAGHELTYWQQTERGGWEKKASS